MFVFRFRQPSGTCTEKCYREPICSLADAKLQGGVIPKKTIQAVTPCGRFSGYYVFHQRKGIMHPSQIVTPKKGGPSLLRYQRKAFFKKCHPKKTIEKIDTETLELSILKIQALVDQYWTQGVSEICTFSPKELIHPGSHGTTDLAHRIASGNWKVGVQGWKGGEIHTYSYMYIHKYIYIHA